MKKLIKYLNYQTTDDLELMVLFWVKLVIMRNIDDID